MAWLSTLKITVISIPEKVYMNFFLERWVSNHNIDIVKIVCNPFNLLISFFGQTLRSSDKYWNSKLPYLQNPLLCQRAWWNSWEWLFCLHWKSLQCRTLQDTCLPVWNTRSCKSLREYCLQMKVNLYSHHVEMITVFIVVTYCWYFIYSILIGYNMNKLKVWLTRTSLLRVSVDWLLLNEVR